MSLTPSNMLPLGSPMPEFVLPDVVSGKKYSSKELTSETGTLIMFICNHCPYVQRVRQRLVLLGEDYQPKGCKIAAINSNDPVSHPEDSPEKMKEVALEMRFPFPYLFDETQDVARQFKAACTPDFYLFDKNRKLVYRGQLDDSRMGNNIPMTGKSIRDAFDALIAGKAVSPDQKASIGCNIKWK